jgi:hypothetical protein
MSRGQVPLEKAIELEERKVVALEKIADSVKPLETIANSLDVLSLWFEEIDKDEWGERVQYYLAEFMKVAKGDTEE